MGRPLITVQAAAAMLGISKRFMYDLAAPNGPVPCYRLSTRATRFDPADIQAYAEACRTEPITPKPPSVSQFIQSAQYPSNAEIKRRFAAHGYNASIKPARRKAKKPE
jgi:predicted DNA-binding transcriptional regulator AlpA